MNRTLKPALILLLVFTILTGLVYPLVVTLLAQVGWPYQANGSPVIRNEQVIGSIWIGQSFDRPEYFWGRPSATAGNAYNASASGGSNYSSMNPELRKQVATRLAALKNMDPDNAQPVPVDLVTASASGLDPQISVAAARYQAGRVARARGLSLERVNALIEQYTRDRDFGIFGEKTIHVLEINLALDQIP